jgi:hypothetical protein
VKRACSQAGFTLHKYLVKESCVFTQEHWRKQRREEWKSEEGKGYKGENKVKAKNGTKGRVKDKTKQE